jgi:hypothetical protein
MSSLDLGLIGNCTLGVLINERAGVTRACLPRSDGDPLSCSLLRGRLVIKATASSPSTWST